MMKTPKNYMIPVYIKPKESYTNIVTYILKLIEKNQGIIFKF